MQGNDITFGELKRNEYFTYKGNPMWIKAEWPHSGKEAHNAYRTDYGASPRGLVDGKWWKQFDDNEVVQKRKS